MKDMKDGQEICRCDRCHKDLTHYAGPIHRQFGLEVGSECLPFIPGNLLNEKQPVGLRRKRLHDSYRETVRQATLRGMAKKASVTTTETTKTEPTDEELNAMSLKVSGGILGLAPSSND